ncbi:MAG: alpha-hydroxy-acid oxidizing protein [Clostridiales Family XIII bacterium]|jgi:isopentenyl diphosphate isomerase/L-lactate dehydrogenase-like FMN-dependent dehydrogenase|nr:alpha-hydroxy-acid oxidizing protein [Clostridiales Family XIII bacterium]
METEDKTMVGRLIEKGEAILREKHIDYNGRAETGAAVRMSRAYIDSLALEIRMIDSAEASTEASFFGERFSSPVMPAALSGLNGVWPDGLTRIAEAAAAAGVLMWVGIGEEAELASVTATGARTVKIVKPYADRDLVIEKIRQAEKHGAVAVGMDSIFGYGAKRDDVIVGPKSKLSPKTQEDLARFAKQTSLPFVVKGILSVHDAEKAVRAGAAALVVSSHSGSVLDYSVPALRVLPAIRKAVGPELPLFVDGGIARGTDVFKALALGANGVLVGRALIRALAVNGAETAEQYLRGVTEELKRVMSLTSSPSVDRIDPSVVIPCAAPPFIEP